MTTSLCHIFYGVSMELSPSTVSSIKVYLREQSEGKNPSYLRDLKERTGYVGPIYG